MEKLDSNLLAYIKEQFKNARLILLTGAGFSSGATDKQGKKLPIGSSLAEEIWKICFVDDPYDEQSTLPDLYQHALSRHRALLKDLMLRRLAVSSETLPDYYKLWFSAPWRRIYTLNVDDLEQAANLRFGLARRVVPVSGTRGYLNERYVDNSDLVVIHLNGLLEDVPEHVTFSTAQYGRRLSSQEPAYNQFVNDLASYPMIFVGTKLDEPVLWQHIEMRGERGSRQMREMRPRSILVTPDLARARRELLSEYNVEWIQADAEEFSECLKECDSEFCIGNSKLQSHGNNQPEFPLVSDLLNAAKKNNSFFLMGAEPEWQDILASRAVVRTHNFSLFEKASILCEAHKNALQKGETLNISKILIITGTAGSGKSTSIMQLVVSLSANGNSVTWIGSDNDASLRDIREYTRSAKVTPVIAIDDADKYGSDLCGLLNDLQDERKVHLVVVSMRSSKVDRILTKARLKEEAQEISIPGLTDSDISSLLEVLEKEKKLGILTGKTYSEQERAFKQKAGRQLLVAMLEATSNKRFEEKVVDEWDELTEQARNIYSLVALATSLRHSLNKDDVLLGLSDLDTEALGNETMNALNDLVRRHVLQSKNDGSSIRARHRHIAEVLVDELQRTNRLGSVHVRLAHVAAVKVSENLPRYAKPWRLLRSIINHEYLFRVLGLNNSRKVYENIENILPWDFHYFLQRGSLEVENGDVRLAQLYLSTAYSIAPSDPFVITAYAYMLLRRSLAEPGGLESCDTFNKAIEMLEEQISERGYKDSYPVHVLGSQVLAWVRRGGISRDEKEKVLRRTISHLEDSVRFHPRTREIVNLRDDVLRELLAMQLKGTTH